jgi:DNA repair protein RadA/Sms
MKLNLGQPTVNNSTNILDIDVPAALEENVPTGFAHIDALFAGDGVTPSTAAIVTGIPGAGKTTLMLQLADAVTGAGHIALYNTGEESLYQVRKVVRRLGLQNGFIPSYESSAQDIVKKAKAIQRANPGKQVFLFVDSLQCVEVDREKGKKGRTPSQGNKEVGATEILTQWAKETFGILMIIGMVTKDGTFAGKQAIRHIVDAHLHLSVDTDRKSDTYGQRVATMEKNRFGASAIGYTYEINSAGVQFET